MDSPTSDAPRQSLLAFLSRPSRPRAHTHAQAQANLNEQHQQQQQQQQQLPPPSQQQSQLPPLPHSSSASAALSSSQSQTLPTNARRQGVNSGLGLATPSMQTGSFGNMLRRRRSANIERNAGNQEALRRGQDNNQPFPTSNNNNNNNANGGANGACVNVTNTNGGGGAAVAAAGGGTGPTHRIRLVPHLESLRSLNFEPLSRDVRQGDLPLRIGRFTEHSSAQNTSNKLAFKSKVVSRGHAEVWFDNGSDTKSSSGTFLNHIRLSPPNTESRPFPIKDGDVLQLGVDYQGGTEEMYRCVKLRIELGREWQTGVNAFNLQALQQLKNLSNPAAAVNASTNGEGSSRAGATTTTTNQTQTRTTMPRPAVGQGQPQTNTGTPKPSRATSKAVRPKAAAKQPISSSTTLAPATNTTAVSDCCICLSSVTILQALFIAPCSHAYHYKCIRPLLERHHPGFSCPLCRTFADLEADVEGDSIGVTTLLAGNGGQEDQMVIDEEYEDDVILEEIYDGGEEDGENGSAEDQGGQAQDQRRRNGNPSEGELDVDAGAETDAAPEMLGPAGMGGFANIASVGAGSGSGRGFIHDPNIDVDPSAPALRLPLREEEDAHNQNSILAAGNMTLSPTFYDNIDSPTAANGGTLVNPPSAAAAPGGSVIRQQTQTPQIPPVRFNPLIIEDGDEGTSENSEGGGNVAVMRTAIHALHKR